MSFIGAPPLHQAGGTRPGFAALAAHAVAGATRLADLAQAAPLRVLLPRVPEGEPLTACIANTAGGIVGGDVHQIRIHAREEARLMVIGQAAEKVYRSTGATARISVEIAAERDAWLEWLPQETILFDGARMTRRTRFDLSSDARVLAGEILVFGRAARGEVMARGLVRDAIEVARDGRTIWADALHLDEDLRGPLDHPAAFAGACATALVILHAPQPETYRDMLRNLAPPDGVRFGTTVVGGLLVARWLGADTLALRRHYATAWMLLRNRASGLAERLPPLWHI